MEGLALEQGEEEQARPGWPRIGCVLAENWRCVRMPAIFMVLIIAQRERRHRHGESRGLIERVLAWRKSQ